VNALFQTPVVVFVVTAWLAAPPQSLSEASQKEAMRRKMTPRSRAVLSNESLPPVPITAAAPTPAAAGDPAKPASTDKPEIKKDEQWWRKRVTDAQQSLDRSKLLVDALQSKINALKRDSVNTDNPVQQAKAREDLKRAMADQDTARLQVEVDQKTIEEIREEARKENVPPGWVR